VGFLLVEAARAVSRIGFAVVCFAVPIMAAVEEEAMILAQNFVEEVEDVV
jgi:hypothetical protein